MVQARSPDQALGRSVAMLGAIGYARSMFCGLHLACRTARAVARGGACLLALGLLLRLSRP